LEGQNVFGSRVLGLLHRGSISRRCARRS
jgi:hypothetical protein